MLKKMRRGFIMAAMAAFSLVMLVLLIGINGANALRMRKSQEAVLQGIYEYDSMAAVMPGPRPPINEMPWAGGRQEAEVTMRFFVVHCDREGNLKVFGDDYISSIDEETAEEYTKAVLGSGKNKGIYRDYRYMIVSEEDDYTPASTVPGGTSIVFLNIAESVRFRNALLLVSGLTGLLSLAAVFLLVVLLSERAVRPYAKNIEMQKRFITDAGHELKTPITSISTSADIAAMLYEGDEWIGNIQRQTARLAKLVGDLVTLSRLDEEIPYPEKTVFSLSDAAWEIADSFTARVKAEGKICEVEIADGVQLRGDRASIQQMLSILLDNAVRYTPAGGWIRFCVGRKKGRAVVEVSNSCILTGEEDLERLFDRFYRPDESRSSCTGGSGLGLSIVKAIVQAHGGEVTAHAPDRESIFFLASIPSS